MELSVAGAVGRVLVGATTLFYKVFSKHANPARVRAERFVKAFDAHDIPSNQIADLEHPSPRLTAAKIGDRGVLMSELTPEHLDWAAELLWINRGWFDARAVGPHRVNDYNNAQDLPRLVQWMQTRMETAALHCCRLRALSTVDRVGAAPAGGVTVVYEEEFIHEGVEGFERLGNDEKTRYAILANNWPLDNRTWMVRLAAIFAAAMKAGMLVTGSVVEEQFLLRLQEGKEFIQHRRGTGGQFHGEDLVTGWGYQHAPWYGSFREALTRELKACKDDELLATMNPVQASEGPSG